MTIQNKKRRVHPVPEDRIYARERFRVQLQAALHNLMGEKGVSQRDLAERLGVSEARVSQMFGSAGNLTVRTVGEVFHALGCQPKAWVNDGVLQVTSESGSNRQQPEQSCVVEAEPVASRTIIMASLEGSWHVSLGSRSCAVEIPWRKPSRSSSQGWSAEWHSVVQ